MAYLKPMRGETFVHDRAANKQDAEDSRRPADASASADRFVRRSRVSSFPDAERLDAETEQTLERLAEIYGTSDGDRIPSVWAAACLRIALTSLNADAGFVATLTADGRTVEAIRVTPASDSFVRLAFPVTSPYPLAATFRHRQSLFIGSNLELACDHPGLARLNTEDHGCATVALTDADGLLLGAINVAFDEPHEFTADDRTTIERVAAECSAILAQPQTPDTSVVR